MIYVNDWEALWRDFIALWQELQTWLVLKVESKQWPEIVALIGITWGVIIAGYFLFSSFIKKWGGSEEIKLKSYTSYKRLFYLGTGMIVTGLVGFIASLINVIGDWGMSITVLIVWGYTLLFLLKAERGLFDKAKGLEYAKKLERELKEKGFLFYALWKIVSPMRRK